MGIGGLDMSEDEIDVSAAPRDNSFMEESPDSVPVRPTLTPINVNENKTSEEVNEIEELEKRAKQVDSITNQLKESESEVDEKVDVNYIG